MTHEDTHINYMNQFTKIPRNFEGQVTEAPRDWEGKKEAILSQGFDFEMQPATKHWSPRGDQAREATSGSSAFTYLANPVLVSKPCPREKSEAICVPSLALDKQKS